MTLAERLAPEVRSEIAKTRKVLHALPDGSLDYKPHEKSMLLSRLAAHMAEIAGFGGNILDHPGFDMGTPSDPRKIIRVQTKAEIIAEFEPLAAHTLEALAKTTDDAFDETFTVARQGAVMFSFSRYEALRMMCLDHMIHHRGQLGVYLRLLEVPVPSTFGPSADEGMDLSLIAPLSEAA